jgi:ferritin-like metal-binding protein YciE
MGGNGTFGPGMERNLPSVTELDGVWQVERSGGALPPMVGVRKRIAGLHGETLAGPVRMPFDVRGSELHYRAPFVGLVDVLEPVDGGYEGRARWFGVEFGRFRLRRIDVAQELVSQLVKHIDEALAMEQAVLRMLDSLIKTTEDPDLKDMFRAHKLETERHADKMQQRLDAHDATPSTVREAVGIAQALMKSVLDLTRAEKAGRNARDAYAAEHLEIAAYQLLERVARRAGDDETAMAALEIRAEEEAMAAKIDANWGRFAELSLQEAGVAV